MDSGKFYFIKDDYFTRFANCGLMQNKETDENGNLHRRPCYYCICENNIYWMVPISSKVVKYKAEEAKWKSKYGSKYNGIKFGYVNGKERAFLIQNICPVTSKYIDGVYTVEKGTKEVTISESLDNVLNKAVKATLRLERQGIHTTLSKISYILSELKK